MIRESPYDEAPTKFAEFLWHVLEQKPQLNIYLLLWDYSMIYVAEREWNPFSHFKRNKHPRLHFRTDNYLPLGASHHQKVVTIDDEFAFAGGLDFSVWRWDTSEHHFNNPCRSDTRGKPYNPYHDVQLMVSGDIATELADLCRERWEYATEEKLSCPDKHPRATWPDDIKHDFQNVSVGLAVTQTLHKKREEHFQIERMTLDSIEAARDYLYIENQYLSSHRIAQALASRLKEPEGPEVVIILTSDTQGWAEESTMGVLRERILEIIHEADKHDRLGVYTPFVIENGESKQVYVHAKLHIVDGRLLKVGSSNLSNRSMRVDTECDLVIEFDEPSPEIHQCLCRLLSTYFKREPKDVAEGIEERGGIRKWIENNIQSEGHTLKPVSFGLKSAWERKLADTQLLDPDEPIDLLHWASKHMPEDLRPRLFQRSFLLIALMVVCLVAFAIWHNDWDEMISGEFLLSHIHDYQGTIQLWWMIPLVFFIAGSVGAPLNAMLVISTLSFGMTQTFIGGFLGAFASAQVTFGVGRLGGTPLVKRFKNRHTERLNELLQNKGLLPVFLLRVLPVAPFPVVNIMAGSTRLPWRIYNLGTLLGMFPGMLATVLITQQSQRVILNPDKWDILLLILMSTLVLAAFITLKKTWSAREGQE